MWKSTRRGSTWIGTEEPSAIERSIEYRLSTQPLSLGSPKSLKVLRSASEIGVPTGAQFFGLTARRRGGGAGGTFGRRRRPVQVRFGEEEFAAIALAAGRAGLTPTGYVGAVALAAARGTAPPAPF